MPKSIREQNVDIFNDTLQMIEKDLHLKQVITESIANQEIIPEEQAVAFQPRFETDAEIIVSRKSSFDAARAHGGKVCVLNFASATNPGGGVTKGSSAQEECLCRCSTLFKNLTDKAAFVKFYQKHREQGNALHNDDIIYSPGVVLLKSDAYNNLYSRSRVDVITCAAPNLRPANEYNREREAAPLLSMDELIELHKKRAHKILSVAAAHQADVVILGAFGCGAFKNDPHAVAEAYKAVLPTFSKCFKKIEFAVFCRKDDTTNYDTFKEVLA